MAQLEQGRAEQIADEFMSKLGHTEWYVLKSCLSPRDDYIDCDHWAVSLGSDIEANAGQVVLVLVEDCENGVTEIFNPGVPPQLHLRGGSRRVASNDGGSVIDSILRILESG